VPHGAAAGWRDSMRVRGGKTEGITVGCLASLLTRAPTNTGEAIDEACKMNDYCYEEGGHFTRGCSFVLTHGIVQP